MTRTPSTTRRRHGAAGSIRSIASARTAAPRRLRRRADPQRTAGQAHAAVALAARPPAGDRDHRTRGRASASASHRPPNHRPDGSTGRAAPSHPRRRRHANPARQPPPSERRSPYQRPDRHSRFDGFEPFETHTAPTDRTDPTGTARATAPTTRSRGCGTAAPTTATSVRSIGPGHALRPSIGPTPGSTTSKRP